MLEFVRGLVRMEWPLRLLKPLFGRFNPLLPEHQADPYPAYRRLRESEPVYFHPLFRVWLLTRYDDVLGVLRDPTYSVDRTQVRIPGFLKPFRNVSAEMIEMIRSNLLMLDPPDHTRIRNLVNKAFTHRRVEGLRPRIQSIVDDLLERAARRGELELIRDLAFPLPVIVIAEMLGVPAEDRDKFRAWSSTLTVLLDPLSPGPGFDDAERAFGELAEYLRSVFAARRRDPHDDLISALVAAEEGGDRLSETELLSVSALILGAGHETTANLIGNAMVALLRNPGERKRLVDDPGLVRSAVEEFLRYDSPVQLTDRVATRDLEIGGRRVRKGQLVAVLLGAANRDPAQFPDPDRLDVGRQDSRHLAFGNGTHFCLGAQLARAEAQIAIGSLLARFPQLDGDPDPPGWRRSMTLRGPIALPVRM